MPFSVAAKVGGSDSRDLKIAMTLNNNGQAITLANELAAAGYRGLEAAKEALAEVAGAWKSFQHQRHTTIVARGAQGGRRRARSWARCVRTRGIRDARRDVRLARAAVALGRAAFQRDGDGNQSCVAVTPRRARIGPMLHTVARLLAARIRHFDVDGLEVVVRGARVDIGATRVAVTPREANLRAALVERPGVVLSKVELREQV